MTAAATTSLRSSCEHPPARVFAEPVVRDMLRALGIVTCDRCYAVIRVHARGQVCVRETGRP